MVEDTFKFIIKEFEKIKEKRNEINIQEVDSMVNVLLNISENNNETLIVKLCKELGFKVYEENLDFSDLGFILIGEKGLKTYGFDKVFIVNKSLDLYHKRWYLAYLLGYYFILDNKSFSPNNLEFHLTKICFNDNFKSKLIKHFVFNLMIPKENFNKQFKIANSFNSRFCNYTYLSNFFQVPIEEVERYIRYITNGY